MKRCTSSAEAIQLSDPLIRYLLKANQSYSVKQTKKNTGNIITARKRLPQHHWWRLPPKRTKDNSVKTQQSPGLTGSVCQASEPGHPDSSGACWMQQHRSSWKGESCMVDDYEGNVIVTQENKLLSIITSVFLKSAPKQMKDSFILPSS